MGRTTPPCDRLNRAVVAVAQKLSEVQGSTEKRGQAIAQESQGGSFRLKAVNLRGRLEAVGLRVSLPPAAKTQAVVAQAGIAGGFLHWHQEGKPLFLVMTPPQGNP